MIEDVVKLFSSESIADPYPLYAELREKAPVLEVKKLGLWVLSRFEDIQQALKCPEVFSSNQPIEMRRPIRNERLLAAMKKDLDGLALINMDPPDHTRLRKLVSGVFSPRNTARMEARIRSIAVERIDAMIGAREVDLMEALAVPLPVTVICELLGVDVSRRADFKRWSDDLITGGGLGPELPESEVDRLIQSRRDFLAHFRGVIEDRRRAPRDDLISDLVRAEEQATSCPSKRCCPWRCSS